MIQAPLYSSRFPSSQFNEAQSDKLNDAIPRSLNSQRLLSVRRRTQPKPLSKEDFKSLLRAAEAHPAGSDLRDILILLFNTGIRPGELTRLRWYDIHFGIRCITLGSGKTVRRRLVPFSVKVMKMLERRRQEVAPSEFVFGDRPHVLFSRACQLLWALSQSVGCGPVTLNSVRAGFMKRWIESGGSRANLSAITGIPLSQRLRTDLPSPAHSSADAAKFQAQLEES